MSTITSSSFPGQALRFNANLRFDTEEEFKRHARPPASDTSSDNDVLWLSDSPFSPPSPEKPGLASSMPKVGWAAYWEKIQNEKKQNEALKQNGQPVSTTAESYPWNEKSVSLGPDIYTGSIITGVSGGVTNGKAGIRYHFDRQPGNLEDLEKPESQSRLKGTLGQKMEELTPGPSPSALIVGGNASDPQYAADSETLFNRMLQFFRNEKKLDPSCFWGLDSTNPSRARTQAYYASGDDTWHILKLKPNDSQPPRTLDELKATFQKVYISPKDTLYLNDQPISRALYSGG